MIDTYLDRLQKIIVRYVSVNNFFAEFLLLIDTCIWIDLAELLIDTYLNRLLKIIVRYVSMNIFFAEFSLLIDTCVCVCPILYIYIIHFYKGLISYKYIF